MNNEPEYQVHHLPLTKGERPVFVAKSTEQVAHWVDNQKDHDLDKLVVHRLSVGDFANILDFLEVHEYPILQKKPEKTHDAVNNPSHYQLPGGVEVIQITEWMNFNRGNAVKYLARAGYKESSEELEDLKKALWYVQREIKRVEEHG